MKFIVSTQSFQGGDFYYSTVQVEDSNIDEIVEKHLWWHDDKIYIEHDLNTLKLLIRVYADINLRQFGFTNHENYNGEIIKDYSDDEDICYIIPHTIGDNILLC